jgi:hypothetical protein
MYSIGTRVKYSEYACQSLRQHYGLQGEYSRKAQAKQWLDDKLAERGTVTALLKGNPEIGSSDGLEVTWDKCERSPNGYVSQCLSYMVTLA